MNGCGRAKRVRTKGGGIIADDEDGYIRLGPSLQKLMQGRRYCKESELSRDVLLSCLWAKGEITRAKLLSVKVTDMGGGSSEYTLDSTKNKVKDLKGLVEERQGISRFDQHLFIVPEAGEESKASGDPLGDGEALEDASSLALCVEECRRFIRCGEAAAISGDNRCTVTQSSDKKWSLCLANIVTDATTGPVYTEFKVISGRSGDGEVYGVIGAVHEQEEDLDIDKGYASRDEESYNMFLHDGGLYGSGKDMCDIQGAGIIKVGDRVGMLVKVGEQGFVRYFHNGKEFGPGYRAGEEIIDYYGSPTGKILGPIKSPLVITAQMKSSGQSYELLPDGTPPCGV